MCLNIIISTECKCRVFTGSKKNNIKGETFGVVGRKVGKLTIL